VLTSEAQEDKSNIPGNAHMRRKAEDNEPEKELFIERRIVTGLIISDEYIREVARMWTPDLLQSASARMLAQWCIEYYKQYAKAPGRDIEGIYTAKLKKIDADNAEHIAFILDSLSDEYERGKFNVEYLRDESHKYFTDRHLRQTISAVQSELDSGALVEAEQLLASYAPSSKQLSNVSDPFSPESVSAAFQKAAEPLIHFGRALGKMWDEQFVRDGFVALMGREKIGKSQWLLEIAMRGLMENCNVAFFQAGDMSEKQQNRRIYTYLAQRSDKERYCGRLHIPIIDCLNNQQDACKQRGRDGKGWLDFDVDMRDLEFERLRQAFEESADYRPCKNDGCPKRRPTLWFSIRNEVEPLTEAGARRAVHKFRKQFKKRFKLATYPNETLTMAMIKAQADAWEREEGFIADIIIVDYIDIMAADTDTLRMDKRHQEDKKWQRARRLSEERHCLFVTVTQTDADAYGRSLLSMDNFSETKTKHAHVTAEYGLNQTDEEKKIGIMRINEIVVREGDFDRKSVVYVLQRLQIGKPYLGSF
jgi:hypothetical protein